MTPARELAERIVEALDFEQMEYVIAKDKVTRLLETALREAVEETERQLNHTSRSVHDCKRGMEQARLDERERCARIADDLFKKWQCPCGQKIAQAIRQKIQG